jgi:outer membrane protein TolC
LEEYAMVTLGTVLADLAAKVTNLESALTAPGGILATVQADLAQLKGLAADLKAQLTVELGAAVSLAPPAAVSPEVPAVPPATPPV